MTKFLCYILLFTSVFNACKPKNLAATPLKPDFNKNPAYNVKPLDNEILVLLHTTLGDMKIRLFNETPKHRDNFVKLVEKGFYDSLLFHRVIKNFMIQGGDPKGDGTGGESAWGAPFPDEINVESPLYRGGYRRGLIAMANSGPNTNGSQFFILHQDYPLQPNYVIFARVTSGLDAVDAIADVPTSAGPDGEASRPQTPPVIKKVSIRP